MTLLNTKQTFAFLLTYYGRRRVGLETLRRWARSGILGSAALLQERKGHKIWLFNIEDLVNCLNHGSLAKYEYRTRKAPRMDCGTWQYPQPETESAYEDFKSLI